MENWEEILSGDKSSKPNPPSEGEALPEADSNEGESLFVINGITDASEPEPEVLSVEAPKLIDEDPQTEEMAPFTLDLGVTEPVSGAQTPAPLMRPELPPTAPEFQTAFEPAGVEQVQSEHVAEEPVYQQEEVAAEEELVAVAPSAGTPKLYIWGSVAAGLILMLCAGALWWKKQHSNEEMIVASASKKVVPVPKKNPASELPAVKPSAGVEIASLPVVAPFQGEQSIEGETEFGKGLSAGLARMFGEGEAVVEPTEVMKAPDLVATAPEMPAGSVTSYPDTNPSPENPVAEKPAIQPGVPASDPFAIRKGPALIQLKNGNFFQGKIMKVTESGMILRMPEGDMNFAIDEIEKVHPSNGKTALEAFPSGYVELSNGNRIWGSILDQGEQTVTVAAGSAKIIVDRGNIQHVKLGTGIVIRKD